MADAYNANDAQAHHRPPQPNRAPNGLDAMGGTWELKGPQSGPVGEVRGRPTFERTEGGFHLVQHVGIDCIGRRIAGTEYFGYDEENDDLRSYFFSNEGPGPFGRVALGYVWEVGEGTFAIWWGGEVGSPASFKGRFGDDDRDAVSGRRERPGGG